MKFKVFTTEGTEVHRVNLEQLISYYAFVFL
jgi:hypothetical protein